MNTCNYIYLHIGAPKTGTTAIQKFCMDNKKNLVNENILYPEVSLRGFGHHDLAFLLNKEYPEWADIQDKSLEELVFELERETTEYNGSILLSSENFYLYPKPMQLKQILIESKIIPKYQPKIIVYIRDQVCAHESWYNQTIKAQGYTHTVDESIKTFYQLYDYKNNLKIWSDVFGDENIIVQIYKENISNKFQLIEDFLTIIGVNSKKDFVFSKSYINSKLNSDLIEFQKLMNKLPINIKEKRTFHKQLIELTNLTAKTGLFDDSSLISKHQKKHVRKLYKESNCQVAQHYFGKSKLFDNDDKEKKESNTSGLTLDKLTMIYSWLLLNNKKEND